MVMALEGIRVLDLSRLAPGPYCSMILGDLGAEVIRIETPDSRPPVDDPRALEIMEKRRAQNPQGRNKRSIILDLKKPEAKEIFYRLATGVDVILEEFRPGVVKRLGVDYETVRQFNPKIIYCSLSGYGQEGPYSQLPGHDINYISLAGAANVIKDREGRPVIPSNLLADMAGGGMHAAMGILAALVARSLHGVGQYVDAAMADGVVSLLHFEQVIASQRFFGVPFFDYYQTKDGKWFSVGNLESHFWANFCRAMGREDLVPYQGDRSRYPEMAAFFREKFMEKTRQEWFDYFMDKNICAAPVNDLNEAAEDPHLRQRQMFLDFEDPKFGQIRQVGISLKLSETPGRVRFLSSLPGQHTDELLKEVGYNDEEIRGLKASGAVA
jgi:crotonobetainyl-CoA:carnitine CoA-transferase CaiB-like acyl-CoA transferase